MTKNILFIGGTKFIGKQLVQKFAEDGDNVYVFSRSVDRRSIFAGVAYVNGDRDTDTGLTALEKMISGIEFDCVYDMCCYRQEQAEQILTVIGHKTKHIVLFSSVAVYSPSEKFPLDENSEVGPHPSFGDYGINKLAAENVYTSWADSWSVGLTIFRSHYIVGAGDYFRRHHFLFDSLIREDAISIPGNGLALIQFAYAGDIAHSFYKVPFMQSEKVDIINIASDEYYTLNGVVVAFASLLGVRPKIKHVDFAKLGLDEKHFYDDGFPFPNLNLLIDDKKLTAKYGIGRTKFVDYRQELLNEWKKQRSV